MKEILKHSYSDGKLSVKFKYKESTETVKVGISGTNFYISEKRDYFGIASINVDVSSIINKEMYELLDDDDIKSLFLIRTSSYSGYSEDSALEYSRYKHTILFDVRKSNSCRMTHFSSKAIYVDAPMVLGNEADKKIHDYYEKKFGTKVRVYGSKSIYAKIDDKMVLMTNNTEEDSNKTRVNFYSAMNPFKYDFDKNIWVHEQPEFYKDYRFIGVVESKDDAINGKIDTSVDTYDSYMSEINKRLEIINRRLHEKQTITA